MILMNGKGSRVPHCSECEYLKVYDIVHTCFYCDNEERTDDMGKLDMNNLLEEIPFC